MEASEKRIVKVSSRLAKFIGSRATRETKLQAAAMQAEFTLKDTLIILCYLGRDPDPEVAGKARANLISAARAWFTRADRPQLPEPIYEIVMKVIERVGPGEKKGTGPEEEDVVEGHIGLLGIGEIIQAIDHNNRTVRITLRRNGDTAEVFTENGSVVGAVTGDEDGLEALYHAFRWVDATFRYTHEPPGRFKNRITVNTLNLVMDALERAPDQDPFENEGSRNWKVEGYLKIMNIFEIAEIFEMNSRRAACRLIREEEEGTLYFGDGRIINAALGRMTGMDAACHLLAWPNARFVIARGEDGVPELIHISMQNLVIEAMRLLDEGVTATDRIASELQVINELFEGRDLVTLPILDKVRLVFGEDERVREVLETDTNPMVRKAVKVRISKTVHRYLSVTAEHELRLHAAKGRAPLSTTEKLVLLSYLSHDESEEIRQQARKTLAALDVPTYRKGLDADLHPAVMDFLVKEAIRDEAVIKLVCSNPAVMPETATYILENWKSNEIYQALADNSKVLEKSAALTARLYEEVAGEPALKRRIESFEANLMDGFGDIKVEGPLSMCGLTGLMRAAEHGSRSGTVLLQSPGHDARVFFKKGRIVGAVVGSLSGPEALDKILEIPGLRFRYLLRTHFHVENMEPVSVDDLLRKEAAGPRLDEESQAGIRLISGSPAAMDIFEVLTALEGTPERVIVTTVCEEGTGDIYRDGARILHAEASGKETPYQAMAAMLSWTPSRFIVRLAQGMGPVSVDKNLGDFFTESVREMPEEVVQITRPGELPEWELSETEHESLYHQILDMGVAEKVKLAFFGNKEARSLLVRDHNKLVAVAVLKSPKIQLTEIEAIAKSRSVCEEVLRQIASNREWRKSYTVRYNLCGNSKTPLPIALRILPSIRELDLRRLGKSKDISQTVATEARRLVVRMSERGPR